MKFQTYDFRFAIEDLKNGGLVHGLRGFNGKSGERDFNTKGTKEHEVGSHIGKCGTWITRIYFWGKERGKRFHHPPATRGRLHAGQAPNTTRSATGCRKGMICFPKRRREEPWEMQRRSGSLIIYPADLIPRREPHWARHYRSNKAIPKAISQTDHKT